VRLQNHGQWERLTLLQHHVFMLVRPEEFLHITHTHCHLWGKGENPKAESALTTPYTPALPRPPTPRSPPLTHTLFLLSLLYCSHPFLESSFNATFWVNCGTLNWLVLYTVCLISSFEISVNNFESLCVNGDNCVAVVFSFFLPF